MLRRRVSWRPVAQVAVLWARQTSSQDLTGTVSRVGVEEPYGLGREGGMRSGRGSGSQAGLREGSTAGLPVKATLSRGLEAASAAGQERGPTATLRTMTVPGGSPAPVSSPVRWLLLYCLSCTCLPFLVNCGCHFKVQDSSASSKIFSQSMACLLRIKKKYKGLKS